MSAPADKEANLQKSLQYTESAEKQGIRRIVFPELLLPGLHPDYSFSRTKAAAGALQEREETRSYPPCGGVPYGRLCVSKTSQKSSTLPNN